MKMNFKQWEIEEYGNNISRKEVEAYEYRYNEYLAYTLDIDEYEMY